MQRVRYAADALHLLSPGRQGSIDTTLPLTTSTLFRILGLQLAVRTIAISAEGADDVITHAN